MSLFHKLFANRILDILDKHDEERNVVDTAVDVKRKKELVQLTKYDKHLTYEIKKYSETSQMRRKNYKQNLVITARKWWALWGKKILLSIVMDKQLRRIIKFNELADNLTAEFFGTHHEQSNYEHWWNDFSAFITCNSRNKRRHSTSACATLGSFRG